MNTAIRDPQFASYIDDIAAEIRWPDPSFALTTWEAVVGSVIAFFEIVSTPNKVVVQQALRGLAI